jgi:hypothetical protein
MNKSKQARSVSSELHFYSSLQFEQAVSVLNSLANQQLNIIARELNSDIYRFVMHSKSIKGDGTVRRWNGTHSEIKCNLWIADKEARYNAVLFCLMVFIPVFIQIFKPGDFTILVLGGLMAIAIPLILIVMTKAKTRKTHVIKYKDMILEHVVMRFNAVGQVTYSGTQLIDAPPVSLIVDAPPKHKRDER